MYNPAKKVVSVLKAEDFSKFLLISALFNWELNMQKEAQRKCIHNFKATLFKKKREMTMLQKYIPYSREH